MVVVCTRTRIEDLGGIRWDVLRLHTEAVGVHVLQRFLEPRHESFTGSIDTAASEESGTTLHARVHWIDLTIG